MQQDVGEGVNIVIPRWGLEQQVHQASQGLGGVLATILDELELLHTSMIIEVFPHIPRAQGLGGSSAMAVAILRAISHTYDLQLDNEQINQYAYECEKAAHGTPSGVDNTVATYGTPLWYQRVADNASFAELSIATPLNLVIGMSGKEGLTAETVARVRRAWQQTPERYNSIFDHIEAFTSSARQSLQDGHLEELGEVMNLCHGYLNALQLSTPELEELIHIARSHGALGAKLTGGGGGGSMVALVQNQQEAEKIGDAMRAAGYEALTLQVS